jgi:hypothetical protein
VHDRQRVTVAYIGYTVAQIVRGTPKTQ